MQNAKIEEPHSVSEIEEFFELDSILTAFAITYYYVTVTKEEGPAAVVVYPEKMKAVQMSEEDWTTDWRAIKASMRDI